MTDIEIIEPIAREDSVELILEDEFVRGGPEGAANKQAIALANNLAYVKSLSVDKWKNNQDGYELDAKARRDDGEIVRSTISGNKNNPNADMTGWEFDKRKVLSSINRLKAYKGYAGQEVKVKSYHAGLRKGGGLFYWDAESVESEDLGTIFKVDGLTVGRWKRVLIKSSVVSPLMFGAKNNNEDDDLPAVRAAIEYLKTQSGGEVDFRTGKKFLFKTIPSTPTVTSYMIQLDYANITFNFGSRNNGITCDANVDAVFYLANGCNTFELNSGNLSGGNKAKSFFYSEPTSYNPYLKWEHSRIVSCLESAVSLNTFMSTFTGVLAGFSKNAWEFNNSGGVKELTSLTFSSCYALSCTDRGFWIKNRSIYSVMNACAVDKCRVAYAIDGQGFTMNSCGAEFCEIFFESDYYNESLDINNPLMVNIGSLDPLAPANEIIKINGSGLVRLNNVRILSSPNDTRYRSYIVGVYRPRSSYNPVVIVDGGDIRPENVYIDSSNTSYAKTVAYRNNALRFLSDYTATKTVQELPDYLSSLSEKTRYRQLNITVTGKDNLSSDIIKTLSSISGEFPIVISGSTSNRDDTVIGCGKGYRFNLTDCQSTIILRNLTLCTDPTINDYGASLLRATNCNKVILENVLLKTDGACGSAISAVNSTVIIGKNTDNQGNFNTSIVYKSDKSEIIYEPRESKPSGRIPFGHFVKNADLTNNPNLVGWLGTKSSGGYSILVEVFNKRRSSLEVTQNLNVPANGFIVRTLAMVNCNLGDNIICNYSTLLPDGLIIMPQVQSAGNIKITILNVTAGALTLPIGKFNLIVTN